MRLAIALIFAALSCLPHKVVAACSLTDVSSSGFGISDGSDDFGNRQVGSVSVACDGPFRLALDAGLWMAETRRLSDGAGRFVGYRLWQDADERKEWGDLGTSKVTYPSRTLNGRGSRSSGTFPIYATLEVPGTVPAGEYSDVVQVTLSYPPFGPDDRETVSLHLSWRVTGTCSIDAGGVHGFGTWPTDGPEPKGISLGSVSVLCPAGVHYAVGMSAGHHYDGQYRRMSDGAAYVPYILRAASATGSEWGDTGLSAFDTAYVETHPAAPVYDRADGGTRAFFVWGDALTTGIPPGKYSDTVNVTVVW